MEYFYVELPGRVLSRVATGSGSPMGAKRYPLTKLPKLKQLIKKKVLSQTVLTKEGRKMPFATPIGGGGGAAGASPFRTRLASMLGRPRGRMSPPEGNPGSVLFPPGPRRGGLMDPPEGNPASVLFPPGPGGPADVMGLRPLSPGPPPGPPVFEDYGPGPIPLRRAEGPPEGPDPTYGRLPPNPNPPPVKRFGPDIHRYGYARGRQVGRMGPIGNPGGFADRQPLPEPIPNQRRRRLAAMLA